MLKSRGFGKYSGHLLLIMLATAPLRVSAQSVVDLPSAPAAAAPAQQSFKFVTDGPIALGWNRPAELPRIYFSDALPALFTRTLAFDGDLPAHAKLSWIFTGPRAGITVELTPNSLRVIQRYYDSYGLAASPIPDTTYPEKIGHEDESNYQGHVRQLTVILDSHLSIQVLLNGKHSGKFPGEMPSWKQLSNTDIAAVITFTRNNWSNKAAENIVQPADVLAARK